MKNLTLFYSRTETDVSAVLSSLRVWRNVSLFIAVTILGVMLSYQFIVSWEAVIFNLLADKKSVTSRIKSETYFSPIVFNFPKKSSSKKFYAYGKVHRAFYPFVQLERADELNASEFETMILKTIPKKLRKKAAKYIKKTLKLSMKYQIDPFWVLSVMWTESHFNSRASSYVHATGLMQIMPRTGRALSKQIYKGFYKKRSTWKLLTSPGINIEMGIYYMKKLSKRFGNNYRLATVAYNMGPTRVSYRLRKKKEVGIRNDYLDKVTKYYLTLIRGFVDHMDNRPLPYEDTYVVYRNQMPTFSWDPLISLLYTDFFLVDFGVKFQNQEV